MKIKSWVRGGIGFLVGGAAGFASGMLYKKENEPKQKFVRNDYFAQYFYLLNQWMYIKNKDESLVDILLDAGIHTVAIYGMGQVGRRFLEDVSKDSRFGNEFEVLYGIDRNVSTYDYGIDVIRKEEVRADGNLKRVDAIIITPLYDMDLICREMNERIDHNTTELISLEDVVFKNL